MAGFSKQDQLVLSKLVRSQRKKLSMERFIELPLPWRQNAAIMVIVFRLATLLHRNRHNHRPEFGIAIEQSQVTLRFPAQWLMDSPLTQADLQQEVKYLKEAKFNLIF
jgi:exopolyphosphatase/guanosine-5'-triphosphate,3'-diphosphate pyrophosphatase